MPKVIGPLLSVDVRGQFGKRIIFTRGGVVRNYFKPQNPNTPAQQAVREAFKENYVAGLTQAQADLLYAALSHLHDHGGMNGLGDDDHPQYLTEERGDDRYSQVNHGHNKYSAVLTSTLDLTTVYQDVPGLSISLPAGHWSVMACLDVRPGLAGVSALGQLLVGSTAQSRVIVVRAEGTTFWATVGQCWDIVLTETTTIKIQARCSAVTSPVSQIQYHSSLIVW